jgi:hypothetical protein
MFPTLYVKDFSMFRVCPAIKYYPSARCAYAAEVVGKYTYTCIFAVGAVSLSRVL